MRKKILALIIAPVTLLLMASTASFAEEKNESHIGKHLFHAYCFVCHNYDGKGNGPLAKKLGIAPANLTSDKYRKMSQDELAKIISGYGRKPGSMMPKWGEDISEDNVTAIAAYIPLLNETDLMLKGDIRSGRDIFKRSCVPCHGLKGRGDGVVARLIKAKMPDFENKETLKRNTDAEVLKIIQDGSPGADTFMPSWHGILNDDEIIDVAAYVRVLVK
jgi:mono/diheme cytochrome c family protein